MEAAGQFLMIRFKVRKHRERAKQNKVILCFGRQSQDLESYDSPKAFVELLSQLALTMQKPNPKACCSSSIYIS